MSTPKEEFEKIFNATAASLAEGKPGTDVVGEPAPDEEELKKIEAAKAQSETAAAESQAKADEEAKKADDAAAAEKAEADAKAAEDAAKTAADAGKQEGAATAGEAKEDDAAKAAADAAAKAAADADPAKILADAKAAAEATLAEAKRIKEEAERVASDLAAKAKSSDPAAVKAAEDAAKAAADAAAAEAEAAKPKPYQHSPEDLEALKKFGEDWEDFPKVLEIREKALKHDLIVGVEALLTDFAKRISGDLAPVVSTHLQSEEQKHFNAIREKHADFDEVKKLVPDWIKTQPAYLQSVMNEVYEQGSANDVVDLITRFKQETGRVQPQSQSTAKEAKPEPAVITPDDKKVSALSVVQAKRTGVRTETPPEDDFATAFNKTVASLTAVSR